MAGLLEPLRDLGYRRLFCAQILSLIGTGLTTVALALLAFELAGAKAGAVLGTALAIKMVAYVVVAPIVGGYATRFARKSFLVTLDIIRAVIVLMLPFVTQIHEIYILIFLLQSCSAAFTPTFQATIPDILSDERQYTQALSLSRMAYDMEALASPMLAAILLAFISFHWLFIGTVAGFVVSVLLVFSVTLPSPKAAQASGGFWKRTTRGIRIYLATPRLRGLLAFNLCASAAGAMVIVNTVVLVRGRLGGDVTEVAIMMAVYGAGSMAAALVLPNLLHRVVERRLMALGACCLAIGLLGAACSPSWIAALFLWALMGIGSAVVQTPGGRLLRRSSHAEDRPALFAAQFALSHACWLITYPLAGWVGASLGLEAAALVLVMVVFAGLATAVLFWPSQDPEIVAHTHGTMVHSHHGDENKQHSHVYVIDDDHPNWPGSPGVVRP